MIRKRNLLSILLLAWPLLGSASTVQAPSGTPGLQIGVTAAPSLPNFDVDPQGMAGLFDAASRNYAATLDAIAAIPADERTFANTVAALDLANARFLEAVYPAVFLKDVSPREDIRKAAGDLSDRVEAAVIAQGARQDVYDAVRDYAAKGETLNDEDAKLLKETLRRMRRNGMALTAADREKLNAIKEKLAKLEREFRDNLKEFKDPLEVSRAQLHELPPEYVAKLEPAGEGKVRIPLKTPDYEAVMGQVTDPALRQAMEFKFNNQAVAKNLPILRQTLKLRDELARLLGYESYPHYALDGRMAGEPAKVWEFLERTRDLLLGPAQAEKQELLELKRRQQPEADSLTPWDVTGMIGGPISYYVNQLKKQKFGFDPEEVREYFPMDRVITQSLGLFQELLGLEFAEVPADRIPPGGRWHPEVRLFEVRDVRSGRRIGRFYLDLFPREGKFEHMAEFSLAQGHELEDRTYHEPVVAMVGNFVEPMGGKPSLLSHDEVETFFHEFGHMLHDLLSQVRHQSLSGTNAVHDFVEVPSQMLENLVWNPEVLNRLSGHYLDPSRKLPPELLEKMLAARNAGAALGTLRVLALAAVDMTFHTVVPEDTSAVLKDVFERFGLISPTPGTHFEARWGHMMNGGYAAGYYGYPWSRSLAQAVWARFERGGVLNPYLWSLYRAIILSNGGRFEAERLLENFLEGKASDQPYLRYLGLPAEPEPAGNADFDRSQGAAFEVGRLVYGTIKDWDVFKVRSDPRYSQMTELSIFSMVPREGVNNGVIEPIVLVTVDNTPEALEAIRAVLRGLKAEGIEEIDAATRAGLPPQLRKAEFTYRGYKIVIQNDIIFN